MYVRDQLFIVDQLYIVDVLARDTAISIPHCIPRYCPYISLGASTGIPAGYPTGPKEVHDFELYQW